MHGIYITLNLWFLLTRHYTQILCPFIGATVIRPIHKIGSYSQLVEAEGLGLTHCPMVSHQG